MPHSNSMGLGYAIALLDELKLSGCRGVALETLKAAVLAQQTTNSDYAAALLRIRNIVRGRGDSVTKMGKVSDVFAGLNLPKAEDCA